MNGNIAKIVSASKNDSTQKHKRYPEETFLNEFVIPALSDLLATYDIDVRNALLVEGYAKRQALSSGTPMRSESHPFSKFVGASAKQVIEKWKVNNSSPFTQSCPDFATRSPFLYNIVFEGKYFMRGSSNFAERELVNNIYQAFFYRALPYVPPKKSGIPWDYDFSCLLAYDASRDGTLLSAWSGLPARVRHGFWDGANVYVMILRGRE
jgi:hypothetical protein